MHETQVKNLIYLVHTADGVVYIFDGLTDAARYWPTMRGLNISDSKKLFVYTFPPGPPYGNAWKHRSLHKPSNEHHYYFQDSFGDIIPCATIRTEYYRVWGKKPNKMWGRWFIGRKRSHYHYYRRVRTTQERRWANAWDDEEFAPKIRKCRNASNLPSYWDDQPRSNCDNHNWKRFRKHQWKEKK